MKDIKDMAKKIPLIIFISTIMYIFGKTFFENVEFISSLLYTPLQLILSILFTIILFITAFICGKNNKNWFEIGLATPLILIASFLPFGAISTIIRNGFMSELIFKVLYFGFITPFAPLLMFINQLLGHETINLLTFINFLLIYFVNIWLYSYGKTKNKSSNSEMTEEKWGYGDWK